MTFGNETGAVSTSTEPAIALNEMVGIPFTISLPLVPASQMPGPVWLSQYDTAYLQVQECGYSNDYEGQQYFWVRFIPTKAGTANAGFVQQQRLINPLFIGIPYQITITA